MTKYNNIKQLFVSFEDVSGWLQELGWGYDFWKNVVTLGCELSFRRVTGGLFPADTKAGWRLVMWCEP